MPTDAELYTSDCRRYGRPAAKRRQREREQRRAMGSMKDFCAAADAACDRIEARNGLGGRKKRWEM